MNDTTTHTPDTPTPTAANTGDAPARGGVRVPDGALWASALVIAALILVQAGRVADTPACRMASKSGAYSMITTKAGGLPGVVRGRPDGTLMIFEVRPGQVRAAADRGVARAVRACPRARGARALSRSDAYAVAITPLPQFEEELAELESERARAALSRVPESVVVRYGVMQMVGEFPYRGDERPGCGSKLVCKTHRGIELAEMLTSTCPNAGCSSSVTRQQMLDYIEASGGRQYPFSDDGRAMRVTDARGLAAGGSRRGQGGDASRAGAGDRQASGAGHEASSRPSRCSRASR
ncbi:MAG: hypothetical protein R3B49_00390 [Phycisphaerales bacterium]